MIRRLATLAILPLLASCVAPSGPVASAPAPSPVPAPVTASSETGPVARVDRYAGDWSVADAAAGEWHYTRDSHSSVARFAASDGTALAAISCVGEQITLSRSGVIPEDVAGLLTVRNSFAERPLPVRANPVARMLTTSLPASDPLWDQLIYSRGRFLIEASRQAPLIVPTRPEVARVIEDCRS